MGIEHPYLAILAVVAFTAAVMSVMYLFIHTYTEMLKAPVLSTYAEACYTDSEVYLDVTLKHERGLPVALRRVEVYSDRGTVAYSPSSSPGGIYVELVGFDGRLGVGQVGVVRMVFPRDYFTVGRTYHGLVLFDVGNTVFTFQLVECPQVPTTPPVTFNAKLVDTGTVVGDWTVTALGLARPSVIELYSREKVLYYDTFDSDPFTAGRLVALTCTWSYDPVNKLISVSATSPRPRDYGGECIAVVNRGIPSSGTIYVASTVRALSGRGYADIVLVQDRRALYTLGMYFNPTELYQGYEIWAYTRRWDELKEVKEPTLYNVNYNIVAVYTFDTRYLALWSNRTLVADTVDTRVNPVQVGLGAYVSDDDDKGRGQLWGTVDIAFDNLVVTVDTPPWLIYVRDVPRGWSIVLKDSAGRVVSSNTSIDGIVSLDVWEYFIIPRGTLEVYDDLNRLVGSETFDYIVGGDIYIVNVNVSEFTALLVGVGGSRRILAYNISGGVENPVLVRVVDAGTVFNGYADVAIGLGRIHLLNASGVFRYSFSQGSWVLVTSSCRATGRGARLEVVGGVLVVVPGVGNSSICLYDTATGGASLHPVAEGVFTDYTSTAACGDLVCVSLYDTVNARPVVAAYRVSGSTLSLERLYSTTGYRLLGLAYDCSRRLYAVHEYGGVYELDTVTGELRALPVLLPFTPRGYGDRLEYYSNYLIFVRGDETTELYVVPLT